MIRNTNYPKHWLGIAATTALLILSANPAIGAESNETDLNKQRVPPPDSTRAVSPSKDDVIYHPPSGKFKTGEELQKERDRKLSPDAYDNNSKPTEVLPPMPEKR